MCNCGRRDLQKLRQATLQSLLPIQILKQLLPPTPHDLTTDVHKQNWLENFVQKLEKSRLYNIFVEWSEKSNQKSYSFKFWKFILFELLEPVIKLYISIRMTNFKGRNAAISLMVPMFFAQKRHNYAPLGTRHLADLQKASEELFKFLSLSFSVQRTPRLFSSVAVDQAIEYTINKYGKGGGGINGHFGEKTTERWTQSFSFPSLLCSITHDLAGLETERNTIDSHLEISLNRLKVDYDDIQIILSKLKLENLFVIDAQNRNMRVLFTGESLPVRLPSRYDYDQFINRAATAILIRNCWLRMVQQIPKNKIFIVAGPDTKTFQLTNNNVMESTDLACNHFEADTRMFVHVNHISYNSKYAQIVLKATDIDIVVLAVGYANQFQTELLVNSSFSPTNQKFINCSKL
ncbi:unnamed protein product [Didymodactylos carnosus]|uniref:Uncharacterized protein n=1 Tax=Didymodactylos carnosus TaxID=1234261 RepID=A0A814F915_9BILA|nr:unnamed protein product [Didymodactylos carnosus]CAF1090439.1 unnamed protein product [Didymodactylos carnosus]CAF3754398.1 unnamed protein product [Didymodactylos carnosus]CAF3852167.1 unnamed protein product [Didymodactylos carnosus]